MKINKKILGISSISAVMVVVGLMLSISNSFGIAQIQQPIPSDNDEFRAAWEANEKTALQKAYSHPDISKYTAGALVVSSEFYPAVFVEENTDKLYTHVFKNRSVVGDWQTSYMVTYSNHIEIETDFADGQITNVKATPEPDENYTIAFSEDMKSIINLALHEPSVQKLLSEKNWYVRHIHTTVSFGSECPFGSCDSILVDEVDRNETVSILVNSATNKVIDVRATPGW